MPRDLVALPSRTRTAWLDTFSQYPPLPPPPPPPPHRRQPNATPQMLSRIQSLRHSLAIIKHSLITRTHMSLLDQHAGYYCIHCTPRATRGACGPTCPLLRPPSSRGTFSDIADETWYRQLSAEKAKYREVTSDMAARGTQIYASTVARWERVVAKLRRSVAVPSEMWQAEGWPEVRVVRRSKRVEFKKGWNFGQAWGRGPREGLEVPPEVKKRKFGETFDANGGYRLLEEVRKRVRRM